MTERRSHQAGKASSGAPAHSRHAGLAGLSIGALGVVYGDIGTSPLYAMDQILRAGVGASPDTAIGAASLAIWTLTIIVSIKYAALVLRAENEGEGGVFALYGLLHDERRKGARAMLWAMILGAGLLLGDGMITPAISVLSAVEGLRVATPALGDVIVPLTIALLVGLFALQSRGTSGIGSIFGPILFVWFLVIAALGAAQILRHPEILAAFNPAHGIAFLGRVGFVRALFVLGALMLVVTGGEAMYADLGHFGAKPIRLSWFALVYPALIVNYLGQGAYLLGGEPLVGDNLFYSLAPTPLVYPLTLLATFATIVASQALISGAFSLVAQAIRMGLFPRIEIRHTHAAHAGQIYVPAINWLLLAGCVALVLGFGSSDRLAAAYGLAVSGVMVITSMAMIPVSLRRWKWSLAATLAVWIPLTTINAAFLVASSLKFLEGGYVPLSIGLAAFAVMATWRWGRKATFAGYSARSTMTMADIVETHRGESFFIERNAVLMSPRPLRKLSDHAPALASVLWERHGVLPRHMIFVEITHLKVPYILDERHKVTVFDHDNERGGVIAVETRFGFMEEPNVEQVLEEMARHHEIDLPGDPRRWIVYVAHENLTQVRTARLFPRWRLGLFRLLRALSMPAWRYYGLGDRVRLSSEIIPVRVH